MSQSTTLIRHHDPVEVGTRWLTFADGLPEFVDVDKIHLRRTRSQIVLRTVKRVNVRTVVELPPRGEHGKARFVEEINPITLFGTEREFILPSGTDIRQFMTRRFSHSAKKKTKVKAIAESENNPGYLIANVIATDDKGKLCLGQLSIRYESDPKVRRRLQLGDDLWIVKFSLYPATTKQRIVTNEAGHPRVQLI